MHAPVDPLRQQLGWYMRNCATSAAASRLQFVLLARLNALKGASDDDFEPPELSKPARRNALSRELLKLLQDHSEPAVDRTSPEQNVLFVRDEFDLDEVDVGILLFVLRYARNNQLEDLADDVARQMGSVPKAVATLIGYEAREIHRRIMPTSPLIAGGLLAVDDDATGIAGRCGFLKLSPPLRKTIFKLYPSKDEWAEDVFGLPLKADLDWSDYDHVGETRNLAASLLAGATCRNAKGINILIHGPVGTGKTEFCKTLAAKSGLRLWSVGEVDDAGGEPTRLERLASLRLAQRLLRSRHNVAILFDEAEDLLAPDGGSVFELKMRERNGSKVHLNRVIEENPIPVLWTCNGVDGMDPAVLRRMTLAIEINTPNLAARRRIWDRILRQNQIEMDDGASHRLARRYGAPPALSATAARVVALAGGGEREIEQAMQGFQAVLGFAPALPEPEQDFDASLVNCSEDLEALASRLCHAGASRSWSLCLHGAPGTGKSQFARYIASRLGLEIHQRRASDLLSKWVGQSEKQIARAFANARMQNAMLIFDEADSLLQDRGEAVRSWELTQVNEMLTWMETHSLPFVCTTNLMDRLDRASLRRFTFKLRFDVLDSRQAALAFGHFFGVSPPYELPEGLTPGDFATVRRKREVFGPVDAGALAEWLVQELEAKGAPRGPVGFVPPRPTARS